MKIINNSFSVCEIYKGIVDGSIFSVKEIIQPDKRFGWYIGFEDHKSGKTFQTTLENAKRLLLEKI